MTTLISLILLPLLASGQALLELPSPSPNDVSARGSFAPEVDKTRAVIFFADQAAGGGAKSIWFARQPLGLVGAYGPRTPLVALNIGGDQTEPAVVPNNQGLIVAIAGGSAGSGHHLYISQGDAGNPESTTWSTPLPLAVVNGPAASVDSGASILYAASNPSTGDLFFASNRGGQAEIYWAPHNGFPGFTTTSWGTPIALNLRSRVPGATAIGAPSVARLANGQVEMVFSATVGGSSQLWRTSNPSAVPISLGNPAAWSTPAPIVLSSSTGSASSAYFDAAAALLYFDQDVSGSRRLFVSGRQSQDRPLLLANDTVAAGENSQFVVMGRPNSYFALVSDLFSVNIAVPPYGVLGVLYPPSPSAFVFDGTGVFPGTNYLSIPLMTDAVGVYEGNLGPIPPTLVGTTFYTQAFLYDATLGDWRLSDDGDPTNESPAAPTTITGGGALVQLRSIALCDANYVDDALSLEPYLEPSRTFHDFDDPWARFTCRVMGTSSLQGRVSYDLLDANGMLLTPGSNLLSNAFTLPGDFQDHDYDFPLNVAAYQSACLPEAGYAIRAQLELELAPGVWSPEGLPVSSYFWVTTKRPIILIHGLGGDESSFGALAELLENEPTLRLPVRRFLYTASSLNLLPGQGAFDSKAAQFGLFIADTGYSDYTIVAHSIGGLVARRHLAPTTGPSPIAGDVRLVMFGTPNFGARAAFLFDPVYTSTNTTAIISGFLPALAGAIREELTPGSSFLLGLSQDWGLVAPSLPVLNFVGHAGIDFSLILAFLGLSIPPEILSDPVMNDGLIHVDEATLPAATAMPSGPVNPINAFLNESHNPDLAEVHGIFYGQSPALVSFALGDFAAARPSLTMLLGFHQSASSPLTLANPFNLPPIGINTGSLLIPATFGGTAYDDYCGTVGSCYRNQQTDCLLWTGLPLIPTGSSASFSATATLPTGGPCVGAVFAGPGLVRVPATRICTAISYPTVGGSVALLPNTGTWPY